jgi:hypothetical protein
LERLVHNSVLSVPARYLWTKYWRRKFAREKFALQHGYAMVLHTDRQHPHVHLIVKAENERGKRLHIDKAMLRTCRESFAQLMREQGIAANATPHVVRGRSKGKVLDGIYRALARHFYGRPHVRWRPVHNGVRARLPIVTQRAMAWDR